MQTHTVEFDQKKETKLQLIETSYSAPFGIVLYWRDSYWDQTTLRFVRETQRYKFDLDQSSLTLGRRVNKLPIMALIKHVGEKQTRKYKIFRHARFFIRASQSSCRLIPALMLLFIPLISEPEAYILTLDGLWSSSLLMAGVANSHRVPAPAPLRHRHAAGGAGLTETLTASTAVVLPLGLLEHPLTAVAFLQNGNIMAEDKLFKIFSAQFAG